MKLHKGKFLQLDNNVKKRGYGYSELSYKEGGYPGTIYYLHSNPISHPNIHNIWKYMSVIDDEITGYEWHKPKWYHPKIDDEWINPKYDKKEIEVI